MIPPERRGSAFGVFNAGFGLAWFAGSAALGALYDLSIPALIAVSMGLQLVAVPLFWMSHLRMHQVRSADR
jgi:predicted MFS family arabinose efflux permease